VSRKDLLVLVADKAIQRSVDSLLQRTEALGIRKVSWESYVHPERDPGCFKKSNEFLQTFLSQFDKALVLFDREGCGHDHLARTDLEEAVEKSLASCGWVRRSAAVVIDPELEAWVWSDSPHVDAALGWKKSELLRSWLLEEGFLTGDQHKPSRPKEAVEAVLREASKPMSSQIYAELASKVSLERCEDASFQKFKQVLRSWFAA